MMLAIYLPASWRLERPQPSSLPDPSPPQALPLPAALGIGDGLGVQPSSGDILTLAVAGWGTRGAQTPQDCETFVVCACSLNGTTLKASTQGR